MTETEKLIRDIETVRESIQLLRAEEIDELSPLARQACRTSAAILTDELKNLLQRLWREGDS